LRNEVAQVVIFHLEAPIVGAYGNTHIGTINYSG
jgi:hypothetical protein